MSLEVRRVVTGHDDNGRARVIIDEISKTVVSRRPGQESTVVWATDHMPPRLGDDRDISPEVETTTIDNGIVFRIGKFSPGVAARVHRTASIDYAIILSGEIDMELDDGVVVHLKQGDTLIQRATVHNWVNNGTEPCMIAFILISGNMPEVGGETLDAHG